MDVLNCGMLWMREQIIFMSVVGACDSATLNIIFPSGMCLFLSSGAYVLWKLSSSGQIVIIICLFTYCPTQRFICPAINLFQSVLPSTINLYLSPTTNLYQGGLCFYMLYHAIYSIVLRNNIPFSSPDSSIWWCDFNLITNY